MLRAAQEQRVADLRREHRDHCEAEMDSDPRHACPICLLLRVIDDPHAARQVALKLYLNG